MATHMAPIMKAVACRKRCCIESPGFCHVGSLPDGLEGHVVPWSDFEGVSSTNGSSPKGASERAEKRLMTRRPPCTPPLLSALAIPVRWRDSLAQPEPLSTPPYQAPSCGASMRYQHSGSESCASAGASAGAAEIETWTNPDTFSQGSEVQLACGELPDECKALMTLPRALVRQGRPVPRMHVKTRARAATFASQLAQSRALALASPIQMGGAAAVACSTSVCAQQTGTLAPLQGDSFAAPECGAHGTGSSAVTFPEHLVEALLHCDRRGDMLAVWLPCDRALAHAEAQNMRRLLP